MSHGMQMQDIKCAENNDREFLQVKIYRVGYDAVKT